MVHGLVLPFQQQPQLLPQLHQPVPVLLQRVQVHQVQAQQVLVLVPVQQQLFSIMSKIMLNPIAGSPIKNVQIKGQGILFKDKPFEADSLRKIENDEVAGILLKLFEFLVPLTIEEAKSYTESKKKRKFKCEKCTFTSDEQIALAGHNRKHDKEDRIDAELGIEVIGEQEVQEMSDGDIELARKDAEKKHFESLGISAKWEDDVPMRGVVM